MLTISTRELQLHLSKYVEIIQAGEIIELTRNRKVVGYITKDGREINPSLVRSGENEIPTETKEPIVEVPITPTEDKPLETVGWCQLNKMHPWTSDKFKLFLMSWEDENGTVLVGKKWACPRCIEYYATLGRGRVSFEMKPVTNSQEK